MDRNQIKSQHMTADNPKRGIVWVDVEEAEANSQERWEEILVKWNPFHRQLVKILGSMTYEKRQDSLEAFTKMPAGKDEGFMQLLVDLTSLSDQTFGKITKGLENTQKENERRFPEQVKQ